VHLLGPAVVRHQHARGRRRGLRAALARATLEEKQKLGDGDERFTCVFTVDGKEYSYSMSSFANYSGAGKDALVAGDQWPRDVVGAEQVR